MHWYSPLIDALDRERRRQDRYCAAKHVAACHSCFSSLGFTLAILNFKRLLLSQTAGWLNGSKISETELSPCPSWALMRTRL